MTEATAERPPVIFINLWAQSGMRHYSESLVHALAPAADVLYVRNYESELATGSLRVRLDPVRLRGLSDLWRLLAEILRGRPVAIHLNSELPILLPLFPLFAFFNTVITLHDVVPHEGERLSKRLFMRLHLLAVFLFLKKIIVHSPTIRAELPEFLQKRTFVVPHINYHLWAPQRFEPPPVEPFVVLFFGRLLPYKGLAYLLEAIRNLDANKVTLVIAGEGDLSEYAIDAPNIRTINRFVSDEEMAALFQAAHAVALPYVSASQSGVVYMAFAFEKPVIATHVGGISDVVIDDFNGFLIEPRSADALASAIQRIANYNTWKRLTENVRKQNVSADEEIRARLMAVYQAQVQRG